MIAALLVLLSSVDVHAAHRKVVTDDGAALALYSFTPSGRTERPVLLIADVGFGRRLFDRGGDDLVHYLVEHGHRVFVAELRGQGAADAGHSLRTTLSLDLPAIARALAKETDQPVDLVAHGYFGALALAATTRELNVRKVVAINTPVLAEEPTKLLRQFLADGGRFSTLSASPEGHATFQALFAMGSRADARTVAAMGSLATRDLNPALSTELLAWMDSGDVPFDDGTTLVGRLRAYDRPTLLMLGIADAFAPSEACTPLRELSKGPVTPRLFSRLAQGDDYAHVSFFMGDWARRQIYPEIEEFLR
ncbi:MAG: alpha/beta hydrolase [Myxococcaceae bacterium]